MSVSNKYSKESKNNPQFNLCEHKKKALEEGDKEKLTIIERLETEIEKLLIIKKIREDQKLLNLYKRDINNAMQEGSYNLIETILLKEIELLEAGDFEAINMLDKLKNKAQNKINELIKISIKMYEIQSNIVNIPTSPAPSRISSKPAESYKPYTKYEGFHLEKTLGGEFIQTLDADIKNLVGSEVVNSKPEDLSKKIIDEIRDIKQGNDKPLENDNSSVSKKSVANSGRSSKGEWTELVNHQEKQQGQEVGNEIGGSSHKK